MDKINLWNELKRNKLITFYKDLLVMSMAVTAINFTLGCNNLKFSVNDPSSQDLASQESYEKHRYQAPLTISPASSSLEVNTSQAFTAAGGSGSYMFYASNGSIRSVGYMQLLSDTPVTTSTIKNYVVNEIQTVTGHNGTSTRAFYQSLLGSYGGNSAQQDPYIIGPTNSVAEQGDLYIRYWVKFQSDLATNQLVPGQTPDGGYGSWRVLWEWKTGGQGANWQGDYRFIVGINMNSNRQLNWYAAGDNVANSGAPKVVYYYKADSGAPVLTGTWFKFESFTHRSGGSDGRLWVAINGKVIADFRGPNMGVNNLPINRIMLFQNYTGGFYPCYQWIDDIEVFNGFPSDATSH